MPTRRADGVSRHQHARPDDFAVAHRVAQTHIDEVGATQVAAGGEPGHQRVPQIYGRIQSLLRHRFTQLIEETLSPVLAVFIGQVRVCIHEPGQ